MNTAVNHETFEAATNAPAVDVNAEAALSSVAVPANATFSVEDADAEKITYGEAFTTLADLIKDQKEWLNGAHRTANEQLYLLLQRCYRLYKAMTDDAEAAAKIDEALTKHHSLRNIERKFETSLSKVICCVFGNADRRRISSYAIALRIADDEGVAVEALPDFLRNAGGVEEVRRSKSGDEKTEVNKVEVAKSKLADALIVIDDRNLSSLLKDKTQHGGKVVLIATQGANGALTINALEDGDAVVNATLTAIYNKNKKAWASK